MKKGTNTILSVFTLLVVTSLVPVVGYAGDIGVEFKPNPSVTLTKARILDQSDDQLILTGQLYRKHRLLTVGHLHVYAYNKNGDRVYDNKHRVLNSTSKRGGSGRFPFRISINSEVNEIDKINMEYHRLGHEEV